MPANAAFVVDVLYTEVVGQITLGLENRVTERTWEYSVNNVHSVMGSSTSLSLEGSVTLIAFEWALARSL